MEKPQAKVDNSQVSDDAGGASVAISGQQRQIAAGGGLRKYREFMVGHGASYWQFLSLELYQLLFQGLGGAVGYLGRKWLLRSLLKKLGGGSLIGRGVTVRHPSKISIGKSVYIDDGVTLDIRGGAGAGISLGDHVLVGKGSLIVAKDGMVELKAGVNVSSFCRVATQSKVEIGESTLIAAYSYIGPGNHRFDDGRPIIEQEMDIKGGVKIGKNCWIGAHTTILDGVTLGDNVVVGAHSLVKSSFEANSIVAGVPAQLIKKRD